MYKQYLMVIIHTLEKITKKSNMLLICATNIPWRSLKLYKYDIVYPNIKKWCEYKFYLSKIKAKVTGNIFINKRQLFVIYFLQTTFIT